jgi:hypothetical protein
LHLNKSNDLVKVSLKGDHKLEFPSYVYKEMEEYIITSAKGKEVRNALKAFYDEYINNLRFSFERLKCKYVRMYKAILESVF